MVFFISTTDTLHKQKKIWNMSKNFRTFFFTSNRDSVFRIVLSFTSFPKRKIHSIQCNSRVNSSLLVEYHCSNTCLSSMSMSIKIDQLFPNYNMNWFDWTVLCCTENYSIRKRRKNWHNWNWSESNGMKIAEQEIGSNVSNIWLKWNFRVLFTFLFPSIVPSILSIVERKSTLYNFEMCRWAGSYLHGLNSESYVKIPANRVGSIQNRSRISLCL